MTATTLGADLATALDPVRLGRAAGLEPNPWQAALLRSPAPRTLVNCCRQSGKSTTAATLAVHTTVYEPGALVLLLSPTLRQSGELFKKALATYRALGRPVPAESETALSLTLENGSRIVSLPGAEQTIRGYSGVRLLVVDEAAWVKNDTYRAVRPMLAVSGGQLALLSTPHGTRGFFYDAWRERHRWDYYEVPADECPRIPREFLEEERRELGDWWYSQEYGCAFLDAETAAFRKADIERAFSEEVETWDLAS